MDRLWVLKFHLRPQKTSGAAPGLCGPSLQACGVLKSTAMTTPTQRGPLGVLGGTFDPIHLGHLVLAERAREAFSLPTILFIPSGRPPHKPCSEVSQAERRWEMACLATASNPHFAVSRRELDREGPSFTILTLRELAAEGYGPIYFITGADTVLEMPTWRQPDDILAESRVVAASRPGEDLGHLPERLGAQRAAKVTILPLEALDISSTGIRRRVAAGLSIKYLVPEAVEAYILGNGLYREPDPAPGAP
jgi:nicotinate-nucleotide adenylyltransferase